ncbi:MAG: hypothetical protein NZ940_02895 [Candidatus Nezhaarchaeota archaeon]|nr:hypothetical protein [Candidatus Nezhaarchaeota archaeon]
MTVRPSPIYTYVLANGVLRLLITPASVLSALALAIALLKDLRRAEVELKRGEPLSPVRLRMALTYSLLFSTVLFSVASVYTYYPVTVGVSPVPPTATFEPPPYYLTCVALTRTARGALNWTDFETYPVPGWASRGGIWSLGTGFKGFALNGTDNNGGIGWASQYYWNRSVGNYSSLWVAVKTRAHTTTDAYKGIGLINGTLNRIYEIAVYGSALTIYKWNGTWRLLGSSSIPGYSPTAWYTIVVNYSVTGVEVRLVAWAYNATGSLVASLNVSDRATDRFTPVYVGVTIDGLGYHLFDDFIVSTRDPRSILFDGFDSGMRVEVWDDLGILVNSTTAPAPSFHLGVTTDVVVGRGSDGRIVVRYPDGFLSGNYTVPLADAILGGDVYNLSLRPMFWSFGPNRTSANLMVYLSSSIAFNTTARILRVNTSQQLYARLILENISAPTTLNASLWLIGSINSTSIEIWSGVPLTRTTNIVALNLGLNNSLALSGYFATTGQNATLWLKLEFCTLPDGRGACFYYPIRLELRSGSSSGTTTAPLGTTTIEPGPSDYFVEWGSDVGPTVDHAVHDGVDYHVDEERLGEDRVTARD